jgi:hypothetical protein
MDCGSLLHRAKAVGYFYGYDPSKMGTVYDITATGVGIPTPGVTPTCYEYRPIRASPIQ